MAHKLRQRFGLGAALPQADVIHADLFAESAPAQQCPPATIVVPIFNAAHLVGDLLRRLPATLPPEQSVILVDDCSTDVEIPQLLKRFAKRWPKTQVIRHAENLGFVAAINTALDHLPDAHHAILLNSDTIPPPDWVPRLLAPFARSETVASVTPLSDNAEILSIPRAGLAERSGIETATHMDGVAKRLAPRDVEVPTGIGFCIALNRRYLARIGGFDPAFGRGYGEEVDWCLKARAAGGRHFVATNLVVGHHGHGSFSEGRRRKQMSKGNRIITRRYPGYREDVLHWAANDPIAAERLAVALGWLAGKSAEPVPVFIGHVLGGGAETALEGEVSGVLGSGAPGCVVLRAGGPHLWRLELVGTRFKLAGDVPSTALLHALLQPLTDRHVIYSCAVHTDAAHDFPKRLLALADGHRLDIRVHDFFPISPSWNLLNGDGRYTGIPPHDTKDAAHGLPARDGASPMTHRAWRAAWGRVMDAATEITVYARSGADLMEEAYPQAHGKLVLRPHQVENLPTRLRPGGQTLGILGGINHVKGASVLEALTRLSKRRVAIIGELDGKHRLRPPHIVHGRYDRTDIGKLAQRYDIGAWLVPSVCPETFSFATHEVLATGLPVACFNFGAQAEAVSFAANGTVLSINPEDTEALVARVEALFAPRP
ncbi:MAG: glycosyltransferase [Pseudomonadota bacterium]